MFPLQSLKGCVTSTQTSSSMEMPNTDKECLKYLKIFLENGTFFSAWLLKEFFSANLLPMIIKKNFYSHIGNTHSKHTIKWPAWIKKNERKKLPHDKT